MLCFMIMKTLFLKIVYQDSSLQGESRNPQTELNTKASFNHWAKAPKRTTQSSLLHFMESTRILIDLRD
jgi:hypothetical protein